MPDIDEEPLDMPDEAETRIKDEVDAGKPAEQSTNAEPSTASDVSKPVKDTLSIVRDVVGAAPEAAASSAKEATNAETADVGTTTAGTDPEYSDVPFNKHPRFQEVLGKLKSAETDAGRYRNVENFISEQGLAAEEAADLLRIGGLMKTNPVEAWKLMRPKVQQVLIAAGEILPDDLKQRVQAGEIPAEAAVEISRNRAGLQSMEARQNFERTLQQQRQQQEYGQAIQSAVGSWEAERRQRDPNFEAKLPALQKEVLWLQKTDGMPQTDQAVRAQLQKAYDNVATQSAPVRQAPRPAIRPVVGGQVSANVQSAKPKTSLEIIQAEVAKRAG